MEVFMPYTELDEANTRCSTFPWAAAFEQVAEAHEVGLDVAFGIDEAVTHARLCREVHDMRERVADEYGFQRGVVGEVRMFEGEAGQGLQLREAIFFELHRVVIVEIVDADDRMPLGDQAFGKVESDEPAAPVTRTCMWTSLDD